MCKTATEFVHWMNVSNRIQWRCKDDEWKWQKQNEFVRCFCLVLWKMIMRPSNDDSSRAIHSNEKNKRLSCVINCSVIIKCWHYNEVAMWKECQWVCWRPEDWVKMVWRKWSQSLFTFFDEYYDLNTFHFSQFFFYLQFFSAFFLCSVFVRSCFQCSGFNTHFFFCSFIFWFFTFFFFSKCEFVCAPPHRNCLPEE